MPEANCSFRAYYEMIIILQLRLGMNKGQENHHKQKGGACNSFPSKSYDLLNILKTTS